MATNGSAYSRENRIMINGIREDISQIRGEIKNLSDNYQDLSNHYSRRPPVWATVVISILCTIIGAGAPIIARALF